MVWFRLWPATCTFETRLSDPHTRRVVVFVPASCPVPYNLANEQAGGRTEPKEGT